MKLKHSIVLLSIVLAFVFSCQETDKINQLEDSSNGKLSISMGKSSIPDGVKNLAIILTRDNYSTILKDFDITSDTTTNITLDEIVPGKWNLKINASDGYGTILYSGETEIDVQSGSTTDVAISLKAIGKLTISVGWETNNYVTDYPGNPILTKNNNGTTYGPYFGRVLYDENIFKMWYANSYGSDKYTVGYAESNDGFTWNIINGSVLKPGDSGSWDSYGVHPGAVIKEDGVYKMYYCGEDTPNDVTRKRIGLAISYDGKEWYKSSDTTMKKINIYGYTTDIIKINNTYYLYYGNSTVIGVATSTDGINWSKSSNSIITATESWEGSRIWSSTVIADEGKYKMLYTNSAFDAFGYAESYDGINWTKKSSPFFTYNDTNNLWVDNICFPFLRKVGQTYYLFYSTRSDSWECKMGVAIASKLK